MITLILLTILMYAIFGQPIGWLLAKLEKVDWKMMATDSWDKIVLHSKRAGRAATRLALQFYFVMVERELELLDKAMIVAGIIYIIVPKDFLPVRALGLLGLVDDAAVGTWIYKKVEKNITLDIIQKTEVILYEWFGPEVVVDRITDVGDIEP